jgi:hypothetical protein
MPVILVLSGKAKDVFATLKKCKNIHGSFKPYTNR